MLARSQFSVLVGVLAEGIRIIRLGGIIFSQSLPAYPPQREACEKIALEARRG